jgi:hypothetical protein
MNYLQLQEQIRLNEDLLISKNLALAADQVRGVQLNEKLISLLQQLIRQETNRRYLMDVIDAIDIENAEISSIIDQLNKVGQGILDTMMRYMQEKMFQLKYLRLDSTPALGRYDRFIENVTDVGSVLDTELRLRDKISVWTSENANIGQLNIVLSRVSQAAIGKLMFVTPIMLDNFTKGEFVRPSELLAIEPLRETQFIQEVAGRIRLHLDNPLQLLNILNQQYSYEVSPAIKEIIARERQYHMILNDSALALEDREVALAYELAMGNVTSSNISDILSQSDCGEPLKSTLQKIRPIWPTISNEIASADEKSVRQIVQAIGSERTNLTKVVSLLDEAFIVSGSLTALSRFHLISDDIQSDIISSYDPDFPGYGVLGSIYDSDDLNVVLAIILLYAGIDKAQLGVLADQSSLDNSLRDRLASMSPEWENLQRSVLERQHTIMFNIDRDSFMALPNMSGTVEHRFLAGGCELTTPDGTISLGVLLKKLPEDRYELGLGAAFTTSFPIRELLVLPGHIIAPPSFVLSDFHYSALFGRSILGGWELSLRMKGDVNSALPSIDKVELEMLYTYKK